MREPEDAEGLRRAQLAPFPGAARQRTCRSAEAQKPSLIGVQFQPEPCKSLAKLHQEQLCVRVMPEPAHEVVGIALMTMSPQPPVVDGVEEPTESCIEHPVHLPTQQPDRQRIERIMRSAPRPGDDGPPGSRPRKFREGLYKSC